MNTLREALSHCAEVWASRCMPPVLCCRGSSRSWRSIRRCTSRGGSLWSGCNRRRRCSPPSGRGDFVRGFARYRSATDPLTEVPSPELLPYRSTRARPYLYTEREVLGLLEAPPQMPTAWPSTPLRLGASRPRNLCQKSASARFALSVHLETSGVTGIICD
jgi:hypothetical protein